ncbi:hypothetical protein NPD7_2330 [Clostridium sporogenes]|uniref:DUF4177 domain-containing protein n=1 Tax=Clostridium TaxID=1485 RepID=UPI00090C8D5D|nr:MULTISPECIES: DUF4177 domain-containing protein [Clostridium]APF28813.1 hypothetical protein NPD7_2330 [Clostridium sporogenes]MDI6918149.1 DUF4177 domain-containing protein [Clostridium botulinum]WMU98451.1 DUF4177 domain-containing protein [Clostridium botulinum]
MKWKYKVIEINSIKNLGSPINLQNELNNYGEEGWELVGVLAKPHGGIGWMLKPDDGSVIFKRALSI